MQSTTKQHLIIGLIIAIVIVLGYWYATIPRQTYNEVATLVSIQYFPPALCPTCPANTTCVNGSCVVPPVCVPACGAEQTCLAGGICRTPTPTFIYTFSAPLDLDKISANGTMYSAFLTSFTVSNSSPTPASAASPFIAALLSGGAAGGTPFTPQLSGNTILVSNTVPLGIESFNIPMSITGTGSMSFVVPM